MMVSRQYNFLFLISSTLRMVSRVEFSDLAIIFLQFSPSTILVPRLDK